MKRVAFVLVAVVVLSATAVLGATRPAAVCQCAKRYTDAEALAAADAAFLGTVTRVVAPGPQSPSDSATWRFAVDSVFKGNVTAKQEVVTALIEESCGIQFTSGDRYLVFAVGRSLLGQELPPGQLSANLCGGTRQAERNEAPAGFPVARSADRAPRGRSSYRMVASDRTVLPGQVVTVTVDGPAVEQYIGGANSYFERRRDDGTWQRLYSLIWYGSTHTPVVRGSNSGFDDLAVVASPFQALMPPVKPGVYRITRQFHARDPSSTATQMTLSTRVTVKPCPKGTVPAFGTGSPAAPLGSAGPPGCTPR